MNEPLVIAVDCSTTAAKAVISTADGQVAASASRPLLTVQPQASWHEQDATEWWTATRDAIAAAVGMLDEPGRVAALCLTHQRETFVCLGADDQPLRPAILWLDGRAHAEIAEHGSARVHELSGKPGDTTPAIYKLAWLARHEPETLRGATRVGDVQAVLSLRLTGRWATSPASADTLGLFDLPRRNWSDELLDIAGVRAEQLPDLVPAGEAIGVLLPDVAAALGLPAPVPLVSGIGDGQAAGLALGASAPGVAYLNLGTSMVLGVAADGYRWDPAFRTLAGIGPHDHTLETVLNAAAYVATWCREQLAGDADLGGTMRLGAYPAVLEEDSIVANAYGATEVSERHRHRYEVNNAYRDRIAKSGLRFSGTSPDGHLVEFVEYPADVHPFLVGTQAHPELKSRPTHPHPLFVAFVGASLDYKNAERLPVEIPEHADLPANGAEHALEELPARG